MKNAFQKLGFELQRIVKDEFKVEGIQYVGNPNSIGEEIYGEPTAKGAIKMIRERDLKNLDILDIGCGLGVIGLTMYQIMKLENRIDTISFADINIFNLDALRKSLKKNNLDALVNQKFFVYLSDILTHIPENKKFDLIVSNPPDWPSEKSFQDEDMPLTPKRLAVFDANFDFHREFYSNVDKYLTEKGEIWFLENGSVIKTKQIQDFINKILNLEFIEIKPFQGTVKGKLKGNLFWTIVKKKSF